MEKIITAYSINGSDIIDFEYNEHTGLYHWNGDENYCGYTAEELASRRVDTHSGDPKPTPAPKKCIGIFAIDSWHLVNGIHCPSVHTSGITTEDEAIGWLVNECASYGCKDDSGKVITEGYIKDATNQYGATIFFSTPREGYAILRYEY